MPFYSLSGERCLKGYVYVQDTNIPVIGAHVYNNNHNLGSVTDSLGFFRICGSINDTTIFYVSHTIYAPVEFVTGKPDNATKTIYVKEKNIEFNEITITSSSIPNKALPGNQRIDQSQILSMPKILGEADVIKSVQHLTGVQSVSEGIGGIFVRGGGAGHNLVLLDNMELMNPLHVMGIYSVFNPLITNKVDVYKGNAPVSLRSRIASCITISSTDAIKSPNQFQASIGNISSNISLSQKSKDGKIGITTGFRHSYLELLQGLSSLFISDEDNYFKSSFYSFYDFNGRISLKTGTYSSMVIGWYMGSDKFSFTKDNYDAFTHYGNKSANIEYKTTIKNSLILSTSLGYTQAWSNFSGDLLNYYVNFASQFEQYQAKISVLSEWNHHLLRSGIESYYYKTKPQDLFTINSSDTLSRVDQFRNADFSLFIEDTYTISDKWSIYGGLRVYRYYNLGPYTDKKNDQTYSINQKVSVFHPVIPSLSLTYKPQPIDSYSIAYSYNAQMQHLASFSTIPLPNDIWTMSSNNIKPEKAHQLSLAWRRVLPFGSISAEVYGKSLENQLIFKIDLDQENKEGFEEQFYVGKGKAYGLELSMEKKRGDLTGGVNYTLSRSKRSFPDIYNGKWFNDKFDRIHDLSIMGSYKLNNKWTFGINWVFATGNCMTLATGRYWMMGSIMNDYEGFNNFRMPSYHRLDISADLKLKTNIFKESILNFSIINAYNRNNPYFIYYKIDVGHNLYNIDVKAKQISLFPIMPSINWRIKF